MEKKMNRVIFTKMVLLFITLFLLSCGDSSDRSKEMIATRLNTVSELAAKHGANAAWIDSIPWLGFTLELEHLIIRRNGQPIAFAAAVDDLERRKGEYKVYLTAYEKGYASDDYQFALDVDSSLCNRILSSGMDPFIWSDCAVVARISDVHRLFYTISGECEEDFGFFLSLEPTYSYLITGVCLDFKAIQYPESESSNR